METIKKKCFSHGHQPTNISDHIISQSYVLKVDNNTIIALLF